MPLREERRRSLGVQQESRPEVLFVTASGRPLELTYLQGSMGPMVQGSESAPAHLYHRNLQPHYQEKFLSLVPTSGTSATPAQGEPHPVTTVPETPTSACSTQDGLPSEAQEVFNHVNHNSSSVEDGAVTPAGTPC